MKYTRYIALIICLLTLNINAQGLLNQLEESYKTFNYNNVITLSGLITSDSASYTHEELIDVYTMRAVAYYSLAQSDSARKCFVEILRLDKNHQPDPVKISPKIVSLYRETKDDYERIASNNKNEKINTSPEEKIKTIEKPVLDNSIVKNSLIRSILLPGWGHLYLEGNTKGWLLTTASTTLLSGMIYYIFKTSREEDRYLLQADPLLIEQKYNEYNTSYKIRNYFIVGYAALWLYSQIDMLFFSDDLYNKNFNLNLSVFPDDNGGMSLNFKLIF
ncbi:MAG: hypothetical protein K8H86_04245 [Ignavibacteriaceae bacterium]|nr:hypothetical protein [Ignavibacteriaceae bacterium]